MSDSLYGLIKVFFMFGGIFGGMWLLKRLVRWFGPMIKMWGYKPWK